MAHHVLKCINPYFSDVLNLEKTFEVRMNDRNFLVGDIVFLMEYDVVLKEFSGRFVILEIDYLFNAPEVVLLPKGFCVFSFSILFSYASIKF